MASITEYLEIYTKDYLLGLALQEVDEEVDIRQGSIIYDTLSIVCGKLADTFVEIKQIAEQGYIETATKDENIDMRVAERGVIRFPETNSERLGVFTNPDNTPAVISIGSLFSTIDSNKDNIVNYEVIRQYEVDGQVVAGSYVLECQTAGTVGNTYYGEILPLTDMDTLGSAQLTTVLTPARDTETNESVKQRYYDSFNLEAFGGNIRDYRDYMANFTGVGQTQIYPRTDVSHNIILSCVDPTNKPISQEYMDNIKEQLDPENYYNNGNNTEGMGLGVVPIGHKVEVTTPDEVTIDVDIEVIIGQTAYLPTVRENIIQGITEYINHTQNNWADGNGVYNLVVYYNRILAAATDAQGVINVTSCLVNNSNQDIVLTQNRTTQQIAKIGTITVNEQ